VLFESGGHTTGLFFAEQLCFFRSEIQHSKQIQQRLRDHIPDFLAVDVTVNVYPLYQPYFMELPIPEFETVL